MSTRSEWVSAHLFYTEPWEHLLLDEVAPCVDMLFSQKLIDQFFFIRYFEGGPHIRLRVKSSEFANPLKIKDLITQHFVEYCWRNPSPPLPNSELNSTLTDSKLFANNSVQFIKYEPEVARYGGSEALLLAESHFMSSSQAVLAVMRESDKWDYNRALGAAIQLHLGFIYGMGMSLWEAGAFFTKLYAGWLPRPQGVVGTDGLLDLTSVTCAPYANAFEQQKHFLLPFFKVCWDGLLAEKVFDQPWFNQWRDEVKVLQQRFFHSTGLAHVDLNSTAFFRINGSYVHMTNNRLGLKNRDEGYLAYILSRCFMANI